MKNLTDRQREVLKYISQFTEDNVSPPTVREIGERFNISLRAVQDHIAALVKKGYISLTKKRSRSIRVLKNDKGSASSENISVNSVPLLKQDGNLSTTNILDQENIQDYKEIPGDFLSKEDTYFACRQSDDSMLRAGILKGDIALFKYTEDSFNAADLSDGTIVLTIIDGKAVIRCMFRESARIRLQAEHEDYHPVYVQEVKVSGILKGIFRTYE